MNKKSSPSSTAGPSRRARSTRSVRSRSAGKSTANATAPAGSTRPGGGVRGFGKKKRTAQAPEIEPTFGSRLRAYIPVAALPSGIVVMTAIVFALIALIATSSSMAALPATIAQFWLVVNMVPVVGQEQTIGFLPMLPGALLAWTVAKRVHAVVKDRISLADLGVLLACVLLLPILLTLTACAMLYDASVVYPVGVPHVALAVGMTALLHGSAFAIGMGKRLWRALLKRYSAPEWLVDASALAVKGLVVLGIVSLTAVIISMAIHYQEVADSISGYTAAGVIGAVALSVLYLPNAVIGAGTILAGSEVLFGAGSFSLFGVNMVPLPPLPLAAALPASAHPWAVGFLVVTAVAIVYAVYRSIPRVGPAVVAAVLAGLYTLILVIFASGNLGVYGFVGPAVWMTVGFITAWFAIVLLLACAVVAIISRGMERRLEEADAEAEAAAIAENGEAVDAEAVENDEIEAETESDEELVDQADVANEDAIDDTDVEELPDGQDHDADIDSEVDLAGEASEIGDESDEENEEVSASAGELHTTDLDANNADQVSVDDTVVVAEAGETHSGDKHADQLEDTGVASIDEEVDSEDPDLASAHAVTTDQLEVEGEAEDALDVPAEEDSLANAATQDSGEGTEQWHAADFDADEPAEESEYSSEVQQEALEEYESGRASTEEEKPATKPKKKRRRGGLFRRK